MKAFLPAVVCIVLLTTACTAPEPPASTIPEGDAMSDVSSVPAQSVSATSASDMPPSSAAEAAEPQSVAPAPAQQSAASQTEAVRITVEDGADAAEKYRNYSWGPSYATDPYRTVVLRFCDEQGGPVQGLNCYLDGYMVTDEKGECTFTVKLDYLLSLNVSNPYYTQEMLDNETIGKNYWITIDSCPDGTVIDLVWKLPKPADTEAEANMVWLNVTYPDGSPVKDANLRMFELNDEGSYPDIGIITPPNSTGRYNVGAPAEAGRYYLEVAAKALGENAFATQSYKLELAGGRQELFLVFDPGVE